ncbi:polyphenol oxidase [Cinnamomum micranthum f. kanehirae]|uniref:Polyphenol oxidase n=1 Tax=Cinnamomum micranthum f. kanehirae TaxID=337451 RepID=A0A3S3MQX4_9MAGN|nr:polyphenol oxidase [Cinnamomum micranthum f. kanehirae]
MTSLSFLSTTQISPLLRPTKPHHPSPPSYIAPTRRFHTSCNNTNNNHNTTNATNATDTSTPLLLDRRNVLLGLGGMYGATSLMGQEKVALGVPVGPPDLTKCHLAQGGEGVNEIDCCPCYPADTQIYGFQFPDSCKPVRVRRPAQSLKSEELHKYKEAVAKMKELSNKDPKDPLGWTQQANIHCLYCNGAYDQLNSNNDPIQMHFSWLFLPWHRWYLYFHERILGSLIGDDSFALPYWNWDNPNGMYMPDIFADPTSSLFNSNRTLSHYPTALLDYKYNYGDPIPTTPEEKEKRYSKQHVFCNLWQQVIGKNLTELNSIYKEGLHEPKLFMGSPLRAGGTGSRALSGRLESLHGIMHQWVGRDTVPHVDMGLFSTSARDPLFYGHHSNVDRMWHMYRCMRGNKIEFEDDDWLNASFLFVDENRHMVKVKVKDCLNTLNLKYTFEEGEQPWAHASVRKRLVEAKVKPGTPATVQVSEFGPTSKPLDKDTIRVLVSRPKKLRSKIEKEEVAEVLIVSGVQAPIFKPSRFDVYVTTPDGDDRVTPSLGGFAGSFVMLPHHGGKDADATKTREFNLQLGITNLLEDLDADGASKLVVSLVPLLGEVTVGGVSIVS